MNSEPFVEMLRGDRNDLGRTEDVVAAVLADTTRIDELYDCYFQPDEWVRLRVSSSFKRIWRADEELFLPFLDRFVKEVSKIDQPSAQWTFAQMCLELDHHLTGVQRRTAKARLKSYLDSSDDWIVQNSTINTLGLWARTDAKLRDWLIPQLNELASSPRKSVAGRASKQLAQLAPDPRA